MKVVNVRVLVACALFGCLASVANATDLWRVPTNKVGEYLNKQPTLVGLAGLECEPLKTSPDTDACSYFVPQQFGMLLFAFDFDKDGLTDSVDFMCMQEDCDADLYDRLQRAIVRRVTDTDDEAVSSLLRSKGLVELPQVALMANFEARGDIRTSITILKPR